MAEDGFDFYPEQGNFFVNTFRQGCLFIVLQFISIQYAGIEAVFAGILVAVGSAFFLSINSCVIVVE
ncbi:hypothetical protein C1G86_0315 [Dehalococcoides mccartyi]|uniref:Uncharacterized protein n=1 Tax=Dehalococcoides mccartyi TaxID=61435 RepID=A0A328ETN5_9CHLR|nr:hypothetical protein C1G86_0315 [Dehalococcoides mccartyi]